LNRIGRFCALIFLCSAFPLFSVDFGLAVSQIGEFTNVAGDGQDEYANYTGSYIPWITSELGKAAMLYLSVKAGMKYETGEWEVRAPAEGEVFPLDSAHVLTELGRFEFSWRPISSMYLEAGRIRFQDPLGIIAAGLFDGLNGSVVVGKARISGGAYYTGLLYKGTAKILMNSRDTAKYAVPFHYGEMWDTYFASRRVLVSASGEFTDLTPHTTLAVNALGQFDVNPEALSGESPLNTQYLSVLYTASPLRSLTLIGGGVVGAAQGETDSQLHFAATLGVEWEVPGALQDMLQGEFLWTSGAGSEGAAAGFTGFMPVSSITKGQVYTPKVSGIMTAKAQYSARLGRSFAVSMEGTYFIRTDENTLDGTEYLPPMERFLGGELFGSLIFAPVSDFMITLGGGAFFPSWGNVFEKDAPLRWKLIGGLVFSL
jgi:hypothetical protein